MSIYLQIDKDMCLCGITPTGCIVIPDGIKSIGDWAFEDCKKITGIIIPSGVTSIGDCAFWGCSSLTSITIPYGVTSIGDNAFSGCASLERIKVPKYFDADVEYRWGLLTCGCEVIRY